MLFNYLQRALQHLNSHTPKLSSADLALLIYTPLNLVEVTEPGLKGPSQRRAAHARSAWLWLTFPFPSGSSSLSSRCQSICRLSAGKLAGGWQGMLCCPAPLMLHPHPPHRLSGGGWGGGCTAVRSFTFSLL